MGTKIFGILASAAIVAVIALAVINFGNYRSLLPERPTVVEVEEPVAEVVEPTVEIDTLAVERPTASRSWLRSTHYESNNKTRNTKQN